MKRILDPPPVEIFTVYVAAGLLFMEEMLPFMAEMPLFMEEMLPFMAEMPLFMEEMLPFIEEMLPFMEEVHTRDEAHSRPSTCQNLHCLRRRRCHLWKKGCQLVRKGCHLWRKCRDSWKKCCHIRSHRDVDLSAVMLTYRRSC
eukprot:67531-Rhodomonas_salina.1